MIDVFHVWTFPLVLGQGKRLLGDTIRANALSLVQTHASPNGVVVSTYMPAGDIRTGTVG